MLRTPLLHEQDCIIGMATPPGTSGVAVLRLSGPGVLSLVVPYLYTPKGEKVAESGFKPRVMRRLNFIDPQAPDVPLDHMLVVHFPNPHSFSGEDMVELHGHGAPVVVKRIMEVLVAHGVRPADPGEFSKRAFFNNKMDLVQAEALMGLIEATSLRAAREASRQMTGTLSEHLMALKDHLVLTYAHLEAALDFSDEDIEPESEGGLLDRLAYVHAGIKKMLGTAELGRQMRDGFELAIVGRPNVGKSSLFNALSGEDRAIVTDLAGTTRDLNESNLEIHGLPILLVDTAGLRESDDPVERIGIERAWQRVERADGIVFVAEAQLGVTLEDKALLQRLPKEKALWVWNKLDQLEGALPECLQDWPEEQICGVSCHTGEGLESVVAHIVARMEQLPEHGEGVVIMQLRQQQTLQQAIVLIEEAQEMLANGQWLELVAEPLTRSIDQLTQLMGNTDYEDVLGMVFSSFCVGK
ncbi:tRNA modification GTPase trmE [Magnetococcus marinus MC-1]|uniref:tRNA modification GTPase MnmE n=1 Tax=Magnetococcus marinus (strain ATCC BAA-1437 / JCM 17883 / MC-1) TaxID=156889 RepID=MNME_MAGMM|nr:tRNA uridine-5-carboxymethylaminomethyl(34) synthesis GTPase MnmE [Magnetococcus marinus]A0LE48.1 RecName: Full=tRNA modification GTPase MnmE [Magnetococcus marinus MC-1]ABK46241.1 tRNA modification GTPase trmE [Magnetococcus marinus MC-1]